MPKRQDGYVCFMLVFAVIPMDGNIIKTDHKLKCLKEEEEKKNVVTEKRSVNRGVGDNVQALKHYLQKF